MSRQPQRRVKRAKAAGRLVDVYSDASYREDLGFGGWAAVVVRESSPTHEASGRLRQCKKSDLSELQSAANALHAGHRAGLIRPGDLAVIRCDNIGVVKRVLQRSSSAKAKHAPAAECLAWILAFAEAGGFEVTAAHVKGHQSADSPDPHAIHNRRCDLLSKRASGARGGRAPITVEEERAFRARQSARTKRQNAARAIAAAEKLAGRA